MDENKVEIATDTAEQQQEHKEEWFDEVPVVKKDKTPRKPLSGEAKLFLGYLATVMLFIVAILCILNRTNQQFNDLSK